MSIALVGALFALAASACWTIAPFISIIPIRAVGAVRYGRLRMAVAASFLICIVMLAGRWSGIGMSEFGLLALSGLAGIFFGDVIFFKSVSILGVRRANLLFLLSIPFTVLIAQVILRERMTTGQSVGAVLVFVGVALATMKGRRATTSVEQVQGPYWVGIGAALIAALLQAIGTIIAKPVIAGGVEPLSAAAIRTTAAAVMIFIVTAILGKIREYSLPREVLTATILSSIVSTAGGATFVMLSLAYTSASVTSVLSSLAPIFMLPVIRFFYKEELAWQAWAGAILAVGGIVVMFVVR